GEVTVTLHQGEPRYQLVPGRAWERIECTAQTSEALAEAGVLIYGTLAQRTPEGFAGWRAAAAVAQSTCLRVCDVNLRPADRAAPPLAVIGEALEAADLIKINDTEVELLRTWLGWADPVATLRARRNRVVVVTHGAAGSTLHGEHGAIEIAGVRAATGGDNVGCGDAYLAILVHGMTLGWDLETSATAATRWAAAVAGARGATPTFSDEQIAALLEVA
ncbi:MAG: hypothetical protein H0T79_16730, partial [Deltaproteobacteria bacterium]|nr:hypothetical protein [Deltaproteobacteria bacterium]